MKIVAPILDSDWQQLTYYDPAVDNNVTVETYTSDWSYENKKIVDKNDSFSCSFVATERRTES